MIKKGIKNPELIVAGDGTVYHLNLKKDDHVPKNILLVGDPQRAYQVADFFDAKKIIFERKNREFITLVGTYQEIPIMVIGTGIGPGNAEIVSIELHILNEYDHKNKAWRKKSPPLNIIRLGTAGSPQKNIPVGSLAISQYAISLDNINAFYPHVSSNPTVKAIQKKISQTEMAKVNPCVSEAAPEVVKSLIQGCQNIGLKQNKKGGFYCGLTCSTPGFYGPQGRRIGRVNKILIPNLQKILEKINVNGLKIINNEMETSIIFRILGEILGYRTGSICVIIANRNKKKFISPQEYKNSLDRCLKAGLEAIKTLDSVTKPIKDV